MKPPWQIACPFSMSGRTIIVSSANPGSMRMTRIPSALLAVSRAYIDAATLSASACAASRSSAGWCSPTELASGRRAADNEWRDPVAILAIMQREIREHVADCRRTDHIGPGKGPTRIVDALLHREVDRFGIGNALDDR